MRWSEGLTDDVQGDDGGRRERSLVGELKLARVTPIAARVSGVCNAQNGLLSSRGDGIGAPSIDNRRSLGPLHAVLGLGALQGALKVHLGVVRLTGVQLGLRLGN